MASADAFWRLPKRPDSLCRALCSVINMAFAGLAWHTECHHRRALSSEHSRTSLVMEHGACPLLCALPFATCLQILVREPGLSMMPWARPGKPTHRQLLFSRCKGLVLAGVCVRAWCLCLRSQPWTDSSTVQQFDPSNYCAVGQSPRLKQLRWHQLASTGKDYSTRRQPSGSLGPWRAIPRRLDC